MSKYIGITIGPTIKTIALTKSPGGMWGASYLLSYVAKCICQKIIDLGVNNEDIISPYLEIDIDNNKKIKNMCPGVGLFHDRILFKLNIEKTLEEITTEIDAARDAISELLFENIKGLYAKDDGLEEHVNEYIKEYIKEYLKIYAIEMEISDDENPLLIISEKLDALELQETYVLKERKNYILQLIERKQEKQEKESRHNLLKASFLVKDFGSEFEKWPLSKGNKEKIRTLEDIAKGKGNRTTLKKQKYYAVVQVDGDNIGKVLSSLKKTDTQTIDEQIYAFSKHCLNYCKSAVKVITDYGGVTIYAGGDDLLFLAPVESNGETLFDLFEKIEDKFDIEFKEYISNTQEDSKDSKKPALSFGAAVHYVKFPLYEAFENSMDLLFGVAKNTETKNTIAIHFQKHAGQSFGLAIEGTGNEAFKEMKTLFKTHWGTENKDENKDEFLRSVAKKIYDFRELFLIAMKEEDESYLENLFDNIFDSKSHGKKDVDDKGNTTYTESREYIENVKDLLIKIKKSDGKIKSLNLEEDDDREENIIQAEQNLKAMDAILRILKFYVEEGE